MTMQILLITWNYPPKVGGMEMMLSQLVQHLKPFAHVHVYAPAGDGIIGTSEDSAIVTRSNRKNLIGFMVDALVTGIILIQREQPEILVAGSVLMAPIVYLLGRLFRVPTAVNAYGLDLIYPQALYQWIVRIFLPRCDRIVAISQATQLEAENRGVAASRIIVVSPGVSYDQFKSPLDTVDARTEYGLGRRPLLLSAGRLAKRKGVLEFVKYAMPLVIDKYSEACLVIVGGNASESLAHKEDMELLIRTEVENLGLGEHVKLLGKVDFDTLLSLYYACDVFVLPAIPVMGDMEGFGIVLLEAGACGKPVVATRMGGIVDAVSQNESGLLVDARDWEALSEAVYRLLEDEELRLKLGNNGRKRVKEQFDWPVVAQCYIKALSSVVRD